MAPNENFFAARRAELGLTQRQIADTLRMTAQAVSAWETEKTLPEVTLFDRLAKVYDVTPERIAKEVLVMARRRELQPA
jgi:transcriptional regulator with XRE-family HTH domain